ncbi:SIMPL domain-containing protein [Microbacterium sp. F51-2R]|jgi:uncharacterized protein YggE|uniref:SIMPL domain-containing protein n=1 Tax=Microbacterium sp. F51-2R TaxID=3445777 RepID=UPI003FA1069B
MSDVVITVRGEHEAWVSPEEGVVRLSVRAEGPDRGGVVERISALAEPLRTDLAARQQQGGVREWSSRRVAVWANRPWNNEGKQLALVHYASVEFSATFTDFAALSWWVSEIAERDGIQIDGVEWQLSRATAKQAEADVAAEAVRVAVDRATAYAKAIGLTSVKAVEIADVGLLTRSDPPPVEMARMMKASFASDAGGAAAVELQPEEIIVSAAVEGRFVAN